MLIYHLILGVEPHASNEEIRTGYLNLVKKHPPEKEPDAFKMITVAYNAIKDGRSRVKTTLFGTSEVAEAGDIIEASALSLNIRKRNPSLQELIRVEKETSQVKS